MRAGKDKAIRADHRGFTIVELLIAVTILSIVVAAVCGFIIVGSRSYASANSDITVQQEAQLALNQMSDVLIDTTRSVNYVGYDGSGNPHKVLKDAEFAFEPTGKSLIMYNGMAVKDPSGGPDAVTIEEGNGNKNYHFYWDKGEETLFYADKDATTGLIPDFGDPTENWSVLADHVIKFEVDLTQVEEKRAVLLELTFENGRREYNTSNNVTIRNKVGVNDVEVGPLDRSKTLSVIPRELSVILEPGETFHFSTPKVVGNNVTDKSVTWSMDASYGGSSGFLNAAAAADGILTVADDEPAGDFKVKITTNAKDGEGKQATADVTVHVKRVTGVSLGITGNPELIVEAGSSFTVNALATGHMLGYTCDGCGDPTDQDEDVTDTLDVGTYVGGWYVSEGSEYVTVESTGARSAEFKLSPSAAGTIRIRATSYLSTRRPYGPVWDEITLTVKSGETAAPFSGVLQYGVETLLEEIRAGLSTDHPRYVTAIRVVDNKGIEEDKVLLYFTIGGGNNYRVAPDLFDLDLNGSYTFYMQAIDPVSAENREKYNKTGGSVIEDDAAAIAAEYFANLDTQKPYGYVGTKYPHNKVYYSVLDKPKLTFVYNNVSYKGKNITYDPVNVYELVPSTGSNGAIVGEVKPTEYENIVEDNSVWNKLTNSLYKGEGNDPSKWKGVYYFNQEKLKNYPGLSIDNMLSKIPECYEGTKSFAGTVDIDPRGSMYMKLTNQGDILGACGEYHIVPGMVYQNKDPGHYEIIDWRGFDFPNLPRENRYYEFDDSTIHVKVTSEFTMDIIHDDWFDGEALFPLPRQMAQSALFPNLQSTDLQTTSGSLYVTAKKRNESNATGLTFTYVRYQYFPKLGVYKVEPVEVRYDAWNKKVQTHSYGLYSCGETGSKWEWESGGGTEEGTLANNVKGLEYNGTCDTWFPLPTDTSFPLGNGNGEMSYKIIRYQNGNWDVYNPVELTVIWQKKGSGYEIQFVKASSDQGIKNPHKITGSSYGTYTWQPGQTEWQKTASGGAYEKKIHELNLSGFHYNGANYKMYIPSPTGSDSLFSGGSGSTDGSFAMYKETDTAEQYPDKFDFYVSHEYVNGVHKISFANRWYHPAGQEYATFQWDGSAWVKIP